MNSAAFPVLARIEIAGVPAAVVNASRLFAAQYTIQLVRTGLPGNDRAVVLDMLDGSSANIYQLGAGCEPRKTGQAWQPVDPSNIVQNGDFESLEQGKPMQLASQPGAWHVYMPDGPGMVCQDNVHYQGTEDCAVNSNTYADDRARITADAADPFEGRYSARIIVPTSLPVVVPVPLQSDVEDPLSPGVEVTCVLHARASPPGVKISWYSSALPLYTPTPLLRPLPDGVEVGADWTQVGPTALKLSNNTATDGADLEPTGELQLGAFANNELLQVQLVNPFQTASQVWVDAIECRRSLVK